MKLLLVSFLLLVFSANVFVQAATYAVLISGSPGSGSGCGPNMFSVFGTARIYHRLIQNGIPAENIITFINGVAINNPKCNVNPGHLEMDGVDFAQGLKIDYDIRDISIDNLFAVFQGNASAIKGGSGRVLKSGPDDTVIILHNSHGSHGWLQLCDSGGIHVYALNDQLVKMKQNGKFKELLYIVDACYSGAVFAGTLVSNTGVYAMTSSAPDRTSGFGWCISTNGTKTCKYAVFFHGIIHYLDHVKLDSGSLLNEFLTIRSYGQEHDIHQYGNMDVGLEKPSLFQGVNNINQSSSMKMESILENNVEFPTSPISAYLILKKDLADNPKLAKNKEFMDELESMEKEQVQMHRIVKEIAATIIDNKFDAIKLNALINHVPEKILELKCHGETLDAAFKKCPNVFKSPFLDDFIRPITNLCNAKYDANKIIEAINNLCNL